MTFRDRYMSLLYGLGIYYVGLGTILFSAMFVLYPSQTMSDRAMFAIFAGLSLFCFIYFIVTARKGLASFRVNAQGVKNSYLFGRNYFIACEDCKQIGIANFSRGWGFSNHVIYFAKKPFPYKYLREMQKLKNNDDHIWFMLTDDILGEVLKHVDEKRVKGVGKIKGRAQSLQHNLLKESARDTAPGKNANLLFMYIVTAFLTACVLFYTIWLIVIIVQDFSAGDFFTPILTIVASPVLYVAFVYTIIVFVKEIKARKRKV